VYRGMPFCGGVGKWHINCTVPDPVRLNIVMSSRTIRTRQPPQGKYLVVILLRLFHSFQCVLFSIRRIRVVNLLDLVLINFQFIIQTTPKMPSSKVKAYELQSK